MSELNAVHLRDGRLIGWVAKKVGRWGAIRRVGVFIAPVGEYPTEFQALAAVYHEAFKNGLRPSTTTLGAGVTGAMDSGPLSEESRRYGPF